MVIVQLLGGLGNQMFQYALGKSLAVSNKTLLKVDTTVLLDHRPGVHAVNRNYDLDIFNLHVETASDLDIWRYNTHKLTIPMKVAGKLYKTIAGDKVIREKHFHFDKTIQTLKGDIYLSGTWQSYKYFAQIETLIRDDFEFSIPMLPHAQELLHRIKNVKSVCLNVRRTDYVSEATTNKIMGVTGLKYYLDALKLMREWLGDFEVFVFSDDIVWCQKNLNFIDQSLFFVDHRYAGPKFSDYLNLMKHCKHYIIPNSTFAWWGAWLNVDVSKKVIVPRQWMNDSTINTNDLIPTEWKKL